MDLKEKNDKELKELLASRRKALRLFRFGIAGSKTKNMEEGRNTRKDIARILTEINIRTNTHG